MKKYTILKGWHYAFFLFGRLFGWHYNKKKFVINFNFSKDCCWAPPRDQNDYDLNKLYGLTFGLFSIHKSSVRLTWVPNFNKGWEDYISLYGYTYDPSFSGHQSKYLCDVKVDTDYSCNISITDDKYIFDMTSLGIKIEMDKTSNKKLEKEIYPYVGGNNTAIQKMNVWAKLEII